MSNGWITATGEAEASTSNLADLDVRSGIKTEVGTHNSLEVTGSGPVRANASAEYTLGQEAPTQGSVMASVKNHSGGGIYGRNPTGKDTVDVGGIRTSIDVAVSMGMLVRNPDGSFSDVPEAPNLKDPTEAAQQGKPTADGGEPDTAAEVTFGEAAEEALTGLIAGQQPGNLIKALDSTLNSGGEVDRGVLEKMASAASVEPEEMEQQIATVHSGVHEAATNILADHGVGDDDAFEAFINSTPGAAEKLAQAGRDLFMNSDTSGLTDLADAYVAKMDRFEGDYVKEMLTDAGYAFEGDASTGIRVNVRGTMVPWEVAVKQKIITFSRG